MVARVFDELGRELENQGDGMGVLGDNFPVLVGPVPLFAVQSMVLADGYKIERVLGSKLSQALMPTAKTSRSRPSSRARTPAVQEGARPAHPPAP